MVVSGHIIEKEVLVSKFFGFAFRDEIFMSRGETVVGPWEAELFEDVGEGVLEFDSLLLVHFRWQVPSSYISSDSGSHGNLF
jgi:hypothetical protein